MSSLPHGLTASLILYVAPQRGKRFDIAFEIKRTSHEAVTLIGAGAGMQDCKPFLAQG